MSAIPPEIFDRALEYFLRPIGDLLADENCREIMINGPKDVYVEKSGNLVKTEVTFRDNKH